MARYMLAARTRTSPPLRRLRARGHLCLVFVLLGMNLYELLKQNQFRGLPLASVRLVSTQVVAALDRLAARIVPRP